MCALEKQAASVLLSRAYIKNTSKNSLILTKMKISMPSTLNVFLTIGEIKSPCLGRGCVRRLMF